MHVDSELGLRSALQTSAQIISIASGSSLKLSSTLVIENSVVLRSNAPSAKSSHPHCPASLSPQSTSTLDEHAGGMVVLYAGATCAVWIEKVRAFRSAEGVSSPRRSSEGALQIQI